VAPLSTVQQPDACVSHALGQERPQPPTIAPPQRSPLRWREPIVLSPCGLGPGKPPAHVDPMHITCLLRSVMCQRTHLAALSMAAWYDETCCWWTRRCWSLWYLGSKDARLALCRLNGIPSSPARAITEWHLQHVDGKSRCRPYEYLGCLSISSTRV
jgi:hypothetical protein